MDLLEVYNGVVVLSTHARVLDPYKSIWEKDKDPLKEEATKIFSYTEFLISPKKSNPFFGYDPKIKGAEIKKRLWGTENYNSEIYTSFEIIRLVDAYKTDLQHSSPSLVTLNDAIETAHNTREHLRNIDLGETTPTGALKLKPKDVTGALKEIPDIIKTLEETRERVLAELKESAKSRNNREIGYFER